MTEYTAMIDTERFLKDLSDIVKKDSNNLIAIFESCDITPDEAKNLRSRNYDSLDMSKCSRLAEHLRLNMSAYMVRPKPFYVHVHRPLYTLAMPNENSYPVVADPPATRYFLCEQCNIRSDSDDFEQACLDAMAHRRICRHRSAERMEIIRLMVEWRREHFGPTKTMRIVAWILWWPVWEEYYVYRSMPRTQEWLDYLKWDREWLDKEWSGQVTRVSLPER